MILLSFISFIFVWVSKFIASFCAFVFEPKPNFSLKGCKKCKAYQPIDYILADDTILQPDLLIVCKEITKKFLDFPPALVVEILSPATALKDRHTKFTLYEKQKIQYYIIVDPELNEAEVYVLNNEEYELKEKGKNFSFSFQFDECAATVDFSEIW